MFIRHGNLSTPRGLLRWPSILQSVIQQATKKKEKAPMQTPCKEQMHYQKQTQHFIKSQIKKPFYLESNIEIILPGESNKEIILQLNKGHSTREKFIFKAIGSMRTLKNSVCPLTCLHTQAEILSKSTSHENACMRTNNEKWRTDYILNVRCVNVFWKRNLWAGD